MNKYFKNIILKATKAHDIYKINKIQDLWSGYGEIVRYGLVGSDIKSVIAKHICLPKKFSNPNTDLSHKRKLKSYAVEIAWYRQWSSYCNNDCYVPKCLGFESHDNEIFILLEDLFFLIKRPVSGL